MTGNPVVAVLGTGTMGLPMALNLLEAGLPVRAWNRTVGRAQPLAELGGDLVTEPRAAVGGADVVVTMLADGPATRETVEPVLDSFGPAAVWLQMGTIGPAWTETLAGLAASAGVDFADAPVLGTRKPAEDGTLVVLGSGPAHVRGRCEPVFDAVGSRTLWVGDTGAGSRLKLVANAWVLALTNATAESVALARELGLDPELFLEAIGGGPLDAGYAHVKGEAMITGQFPLSFAVRHALKDADLVLAEEGDADLAGVRAARRHLAAAAEAGHADDDMAALYRGVVSRDRADARQGRTAGADDAR
ncbi:3-hydroxyisobutyrate dehydrogenase [Prauserella sp. PE36]|uniref:NAD(P)-dependent oxidoreductase n=1 Tax=Prauserella sp. PE36 TaxID=1504709 RepID=UPI000D885CF9|nr:NAD(P)-dependent oxidoreductase [Prauserella sp. PE36]PXY23668.1 3-hydroxyisobutyrate dehydrogenase [Prauserella coralliicola]RBM16727.1 3-hydroxyisobutyrate dehydrogenase [Prauserella sp. PE36]